MKTAFIIMQIGDAELDRVCTAAIVPAVKACQLEPRRVDRHNRGDLLKSEIIRLINEAEIVVADLTNERPNCYLEVGYAMGAGKTRHLILSAREDHRPDREGRAKGSPKVHFDLAGYDILYWSPGDAEGYRRELEKRIRRRLSESLVSSASPAASPDSDGAFAGNHLRWIFEESNRTAQKLADVSVSAFVELSLVPVKHTRHFTANRLLEAARAAEVGKSEFPIAKVFDVPGLKPRPTKTGIAADIPLNGSGVSAHWAISSSGDFYAARSLVEQQRHPGMVDFEQCIEVGTELLIYCSRLYGTLGLAADEQILVRLAYSGVRDARLGTFRRGPLSLPREYRTSENQLQSGFVVSLGEITAGLPALAKTLVSRILESFDFFEVPQDGIEAALEELT